MKRKKPKINNIELKNKFKISVLVGIILLSITTTTPVAIKTTEKTIKTKNPNTTLNRYIIHPKPISITAQKNIKYIEGIQKLHEKGYTGKKVKVGIIDLGFSKENLKKYVPNNELINIHTQIDSEPPRVGVYHGTYVVATLLKNAPDVEVYISKGNATSKEALQWLRKQNVDIISQSRVGLSRDRDGVYVQRYVRTVENGTTILAGAGNSGRSHYLSKFRDADSDGYHEFRDGSEKNKLKKKYDKDKINKGEIYVKNGNYTVELYKEKNDELVAKGDTGIFDPVDIKIQNHISNKTELYIKIKDNNKKTDRKIQIYVKPYSIILEHKTRKSSITSPANGEKIISVGAYSEPCSCVPNFSSSGPTLNGKKAMDVVVPNVFNLNGTQVGGTSISTPALAGYIAIIEQATKKNLSSKTKREIIYKIPKDIRKPGHDPISGYGVIKNPAKILNIDTTDIKPNIQIDSKLPPKYNNGSDIAVKTNTNSDKATIDLEVEIQDPQNNIGLLPVKVNNKKRTNIFIYKPQTKTLKIDIKKGKHTLQIGNTIKTINVVDKKTSIIDQYDTNNNDEIERSELKQAIIDYVLKDKITHSQIRKIIIEYVS